MSLTAADIAEILRLVEDSTFDELSLEFDGLKLQFKRGTDGPAVERPAIPSPQAAAFAAVNPAPAEAVTADPNLQEVRSPMLGTFYRAPKPGEEPYVTVGAPVEEGTIVCIIEVMKLMNTVRAEVCGTVADIPVADGALVEYGDILMRVRKSE